MSLILLFPFVVVLSIFWHQLFNRISDYWRLRNVQIGSMYYHAMYHRHIVIKSIPMKLSAFEIFDAYIIYDAETIGCVVEDHVSGFDILHSQPIEPNSSEYKLVKLLTL